ncbi:MAG: trimethylamine methyltransferase family protein, partial [Spirochaetota bacterium]
MESNINKMEGVQLKVLSPAQIKKIHLASLEVLERTGVRIKCKQAIQLLKEGGCRVEGDVVHFPPHLVEWAIQSAPSQVLVYDRLGNQKLALGGHNTYFGLGPTLLNMIDPDTGLRRPFKQQDTRNAARVADALPNIDWVMGYGTISDVPAEYSDRFEFEAMVENTSKPIVIWNYTVEGLEDTIEMASAAAGSRENLFKKPFIVSYSEPISPLTGDEAATRKLLLASQYGIPVIHTPCVQSGASAPVTPAGELVSSNAENLCSLVISQLKTKGAPFLIGGVLTIMDMRDAIMSYGAPELSLIMAAYMDIAHYYQIPTWGTAGCTDSKLPDEQAAVEGTFSCLFSMLSGANLVHDVGYLESGKTGALEMLVQVDQSLGYIKRIAEGIKVDEETLAVDVIKEVGPGGNFLTHSHTLNNFKKELFEPVLSDRQTISKWTSDGKKTMQDR